jgi:hypothetical protein
VNSLLKKKKRLTRSSERLRLRPPRRGARRSTSLALTKRRRMKKLRLRQMLLLGIRNPRERAPSQLRAALRDPEVKARQDPLIAAESPGLQRKAAVPAQSKRDNPLSEETEDRTGP